MARLMIHDGTRTQMAGRALSWALTELSRYHPIKSVKPKPGEIHLPSYNFVKDIERRSFDQNRRQVNRDRLEEILTNTSVIQNNRDQQHIILIEHDLYAGNLNWCFGGYHHYKNFDFVTVSTKRMQDIIHLQYILAHELGHLYGAAPSNRSNTEIFLGSHCINNNCVMQQKDTVEKSARYTHQIHLSNSPTFCGQCQADLQKNVRGL
ncbi:MAG: hypothetical protein ABH824_06740 [Nanoarchaeota archaeon]|nr:hypothetical protein [Nanoarchaeota archaeon]MBU1631708.1 hypothetical protein [Nanoarchaeota archaeon]MBU1876230.1 hypothetical protein [Nanoarchaeota archaeon]